MAMETTDITVEILRRIQAEQVAHRQETRALQQTMIDVVRLIQRMDNRFAAIDGRFADIDRRFADVDGRFADMERRDNDMKADLETMFKMELIGQNAHHQTRMEQMLHDELAEIRERLDRIEAKI